MPSKAVIDIINAVHALTDEDKRVLFASLGQGEGGATHTDIATARDQQVEKLQAQLLESESTVDTIKMQLKQLGVSVK